MIISKPYAARLVKKGKAEVVGRMFDGRDSYLVINRLDKFRTDHALLGAGLCI